jgi:hypothetical protein
MCGRSQQLCIEDGHAVDDAVPEELEDSMTESTLGGESGFEEEETSISSDVRSGYEDDQPPARVVEETSEDDVDSHGADRAAGYEDDDLDDEDGTFG